ncbi:nucleoside deaminase [Bacteroidota bacterium]
MDDIFFMRQAISEAKLAYEKDEVPVGAVIVCQNRIIARAHNRTEELVDVTAHAEIQAITSASNFLNGKYLHDCTLYVSLEPCPMCAGALAWSQIGKIVFATKDVKRGYRLFYPSILHPKTIVTEGILEKECANLLKDFFKTKRL